MQTTSPVKDTENTANMPPPETEGDRQRKLFEDPRRQALIRHIDVLDAELSTDEEEEVKQPPRRLRAQGKVRNAGEVKNIMIQEQILADIDDSVDLIIRGDDGVRGDELPESWDRSCP